jgi:8-amino-7-oxononanoate synthase
VLESQSHGDACAVNHKVRSDRRSSDEVPGTSARVASPWRTDLRRLLSSLDEQSLRRRLRPVESPADPVVVRDGRQLLNLSSNNYLGLAGDPRIEQAMADAAWRGAGSTASRLVVGTDQAVLELEKAIAAHKGAEAALLFGSGYLANLGTLSALLDRGDAVFSDRLNHASIIDGVRLSGATIHRYEHCDPDHLASLLHGSDARRKLIVTETIFSMDGDAAPLEELVELKERHGAALVIDEAHAGGIFGRKGAGYAHELGLAERVDLHIGTFGKAYGVYGAYAAGSREFIDFLVNRCRPFVFTTALPPAVVAGIAAALEIVRTADGPRRDLLEHAAWFRARLAELGFATGTSASQIVPATIGENDAALAFAEALTARGVLAVAIRPPTVPAGTARVRFSLTAAHTREQLEEALGAIEGARGAIG